MTFGDIFRDRELLVWVANVPALIAAVHGYSHAPAMASLSHSLHLLHLPGKANPAYIPSRVPFLCRNGSPARSPVLVPAASRRPATPQYRTLLARMPPRAHDGTDGGDPALGVPTSLRAGARVRACRVSG